MIWNAQIASPRVLVSDWEKENVYECIIPSDISKQQLLFPYKFPTYKSTVNLKLKFKINGVNERKLSPIWLIVVAQLPNFKSMVIIKNEDLI